MVAPPVWDWAFVPSNACASRREPRRGPPTGVPGTKGSWLLPTFDGERHRSCGRQREQAPLAAQRPQSRRWCWCAAMNVAGMAAHLLDGREGAVAFGMQPLGSDKAKRGDGAAAARARKVPYLADAGAGRPPSFLAGFPGVAPALRVTILAGHSQQPATLDVYILA